LHGHPPDRRRRNRGQLATHPLPASIIAHYGAAAFRIEKNNERQSVILFSPVEINTFYFPPNDLKNNSGIIRKIRKYIVLYQIGVMALLDWALRPLLRQDRTRRSCPLPAGQLKRA
jgi:hypothetical protein